MDHQKQKNKQQLRRRRHVRQRITGTQQRPRLSVFRSNKHIYAQLIDDLQGKTIAGTSTKSKDVREAANYGGNKSAAAVVGKRIAEIAKEKGIAKVAFDRGHYRYHGRIKALAESARKEGLDF